jgi:mRNA interferase MazF
VVVSSDAYHRWRIDVVVMAITSQIARAASASGDVAVVEWQQAGLLKPSLIKPVFATIERRIVVRALGILAPRDQSALRQALTVLLG